MFRRLVAVITIAFVCNSWAEAIRISDVKASLDHFPVRKLGDQIVDLRGKILYLTSYGGTDPNKNWKIIIGKVSQVLGKGELLVTRYEDCTWLGDSVIIDETQTKTIHLRNFPVEKVLVDGDLMVALATPSGRYQYTKTTGALATIEDFDFGQVISKEERAALDKERLEKAVEIGYKEGMAAAGLRKQRAKAAEQKAVEYHTKQAEAGNAFSQLELGKRYMDGKGVEKDVTQARRWLSAAAANGRTEAEELLKKLE